MYVRIIRHKLDNRLVKDKGKCEETRKLGSISSLNHRRYLLLWNQRNPIMYHLNYSFLYMQGCISSLVYTTRPELFIENTLRESRLSSEPEFELCKPLRVLCLRARARASVSRVTYGRHTHTCTHTHRHRSIVET